MALPCLSLSRHLLFPWGTVSLEICVLWGVFLVYWTYENAHTISPAVCVMSYLLIISHISWSLPPSTGTTVTHFTDYILVYKWKYIAFCVWLPCLSLIILRYIGVTEFIVNLIFMVVQYSLNQPLLIDGHLACIEYFIHKATLNVRVKVMLWGYAFIEWM